MSETNENITRLMAEISEVLDDVEAGAETAPQRSVALRKARALGKALEDVEGWHAEQDAVDGIVAMLERSLPVRSEYLDERIKMAEKALDAAALLPGIPEDDLRALLERAEAAFSVTPAAGSKPTVRGIGVPIRVECDCGDLVRESSTGDWTSIRHQAKVHASECKVANPMVEDGEFANNFDLAREAIVKDRASAFRTGGLVFSLPASTTAAAAAAGE